MTTHLIFDLQGTPHLVTETENGFLTHSGVFSNSNIRTACPVGELENRVTRFKEGDEVFDAFNKKITEVGACYAGKGYTVYTLYGSSFTSDGRFDKNEDTIDLFHLSEAKRLGLVPRTEM